ncbi:MAG: hypothetical protein MR333_05740 [Porphyromonadaceae bacterium]|nr:hypothetical protein [Porphyromonadaceae bacterium]
MALFYDSHAVPACSGLSMQAVQDAVRRFGGAGEDIEDYVFRVTDLSDGTSARYRINAGGNLKLIVEE